MRLSLERKISVGFAIAFTVLLLTGISAWWSATRYRETAAWVEHTHEVLYQLESGLAELLNMQTATRGFLLTGEEHFLAPYQAGRVNAAKIAETLRANVGDNPQQMARLTQLLDHGRQIGELMSTLIADRRARGLGAIDSARLAHGDQLMATIRNVIHEMQATEFALLKIRSAETTALSRATLTITIIFIVFACVLVATAGWMVRRDFARRALLDQQVKQLNTELQANNERLQISNQELEAFSYSISHDLRAPLRHVTGFASLLEKKHAAALDQQGRHYLSTISQAAVRMGQLIDDLLAFSRMGRSTLKATPVNQTDLVARVISDLKTGEPAPEWKIASLPPVEADNAMLRQVWFNLLDNAVKYSRKAAAPVIEVAHRFDEKLNEDIFSIRDNGVGFDMKYGDKLFGVFSRLHSADEFEGTGIGLALVRRIIARHAGRTWAESRPGEGATFYFSLPHHHHAVA
ncbi:sensor histidine kinase [Oleiharenicola lentus]|uniref:sensor histidine kinase n=1 Tax=Oleiharenicola lentus TaxID=2508720 RepID=UPI003F678DC3